MKLHEEEKGVGKLAIWRFALTPLAGHGRLIVSQGAPRPREGKELIMVKTLTPKELAQELDTDAKTCRKFLRSKASGLAADAPGKGGRWAIEARKVRSLRTKFTKWVELEVAARDAARVAKETEVEDDAPGTDLEVIGEDEVEVIEVD